MPDINYDSVDSQTQEKLLHRIDMLIQALIANYMSKAVHQDSRDHIDYEVVPGKKYYKIVLINWGSRSVHAFVDKEGNVYKPASWRAPAKHVRYNLLDSVQYARCLERADWAGSYLYL